MGRAGAAGGFSLAEMVMALAVFGILSVIAIPRFEAMLAHIRVRGALNRVAVDLAYTRQLAARTGARARLRIEPSPDCPSPRTGAAGHRYRVIAGPDSVAYVVDLRLDGPSLCLTTNQSREVVFDSRGLLVGFNNRTMTVRQGDRPPVSLTLSAVGRVLRD
jgi:prepilin-type N-terminal cleavage/methylation domain-containing protein